MGSIRKRVSKRTGECVFQARIQVKGMDERWASFADRAQAEQFIAKVEPGMKAQGKLNMVAALWAPAGKITPEQYLRQELTEIIEEFVASPKCSEADKKNAQGVKRHVRKVKIGELDADWVEGYIERMIKTQTHMKTLYSYATIDGHMGVISRACRWSAKQRKVTPWVLPFSKRDNFPLGWENKRSRRLSAQEEQWIRDHFLHMDNAAREHWKLLLDLALETGARLQEMVKAHPSEFDVARRVWSIPAKHTKKKTARFVVLTYKAQAAVMRLMELAGPKCERVFHPIKNTHAATNKFCHTVRLLGIKDLRFHDLRHEAISRMVSDQRDVRVLEIMQMVGHKSSEMLHRYSHGRADEIAQRMK